MKPRTVLFTVFGDQIKPVHEQIVAALHHSEGHSSVLQIGNISIYNVLALTSCNTTLSDTCTAEGEPHFATFELSYYEEEGDCEEWNLLHSAAQALSLSVVHRPTGDLSYVNIQGQLLPSKKLTLHVRPIEREYLYRTLLRYMLASMDDDDTFIMVQSVSLEAVDELFEFKLECAFGSGSVPPDHKVPFLERAMAE